MKTGIQVAHPDIVFYDFYAAYNSPVAADKDAYLSIAPIHIPKPGLTSYAENRTGILAQVAPNLGPIVSASVYFCLIDTILTQLLGLDTAHTIRRNCSPRSVASPH